jgi:diguanylate cyclase (GGDEF)-like protein
MRRSSFSSGWAASHLAAPARIARESIARPARSRARATIGRPALVAACALAAVCVLGATPSRASCLDQFDPDIRRLDTEVSANAVKALREIDARLEAERSAAHPDPHRLAELHAVEAQAYSILELDGSARSAATEGLKLARVPNDPVHLNLLTAYAENVYDAPDLARAAAAVDAARRAQPRGSLADICLSITLGRVEYREDRSDLAVSNLMHAYQASAASALTDQRVLAAWALAPVMRSMGDFAQALALNQEVVDAETAHQATLALSVARYLRGEIFGSMHSYADSLDQFAEARALSVAVSDKQGIAFADLQMCRDEIELGQLADARTRCESALPAFTAAHSLDMVKQTQTYLARNDLARGQAARALDRLDRVLEHGGAELMPPRQLPSVLELRARTNAALGHYRQAFADLSAFLRLYSAANDADRATIAAAERARFATDRANERNAALKRELASAHELSARQHAELRWIAAAGAAGGLVIALLTYILIANLRHRRQLLRLAIEDGLTGLPNRRRTAQLASAALAAAGSAQRPLTVALIDLDRFKMINDRGGHAAGDLALREFARIGRECIRSGDILGRWGGEEFLLVLPDTTLDTALASVDRLRARASAIALPRECAGLRVSMSAGLAASGADVRTLDEIIARADAALYEAKNSGRDLVRIADESFQAASSGVRRALRQA